MNEIFYGNILTDDSRWRQMQEGAFFLDEFLQQLIQSGDAGQYARELMEAAVRMVDFKSGSIAKRMRILAELIESEEDTWPEKLAILVGKLNIYARKIIQSELNDMQQEPDWLQWAGWTIRKDQMQRIAPVHDKWLVLGIVTEKEEKLRVNKTWLYGINTQKLALHMEYLIAFQKPMVYWNVGKQYEATMRYFPGISGRVQVTDPTGDEFGKWPDYGYDIESAKQNLINALSRFPLIEQWPLLLSPITAEINKDYTVNIFDSTGTLNAVRLNKESNKNFLAFSSSGSFPVFAQLSHGEIHLLSCGFGREVHTLR